MLSLRAIIQVSHVEAVSALSGIKIANDRQKVDVRHSHYNNSRKVGDPSQYTNVEICNNPVEWKYVQRVLPMKYIPNPKIKDTYPSGWQPQKASPNGLPYFVERTKNHLFPVYLDVSYRGLRKLTIIKNITGDIWKLNKDLTVHLQEMEKKTLIGSRVDEIACMIKLKGDHVYYTSQWLLKKGL